ncbi:MAG: phosphatase PAP2 family protein [Anaerolineales bacterium]|nr:phosphatase PAP2 family protein [Anaerolineales bacterium]
MQTLIDSGLALIIAIQHWGTGFLVPMEFFSFLGTEDFFLLILPLLYWCVSARLGLRVGLMLVFTGGINLLGKVLLAGPRPYWVSAQVMGWWPETSFGAPSGHAQSAMSVWGLLAWQIQKRWAWVVAGALIFLIGFSRLYLGAHFPHDVLLGWALGALLLWAFVKLEAPVLDWFARKTFSQQILFSFLISLILILAGLTVTALRQNYQLPSAWVTNALRASPEALLPVDRNPIFTFAGIAFGLLAGAVWIQRQGGWQVSAPWAKRALCYLIGVVGVLIFWMGLGAILPRGDGFVFYALRYLRYALVGAWVAAGAPWVFMRLKLG